MDDGAKRLNIVLTLVLAGIVGLTWLLHLRTPARPNPLLPWSNMAVTRAAEAFGLSPVLRGGMVQQTPPAGTVARGADWFPYAPGPDEAARAGRELASPFAATNTAARDRGKVVYDTYCAVCHGAGGAGDGPVAQRGFPPPPSILVGNAATMPDGRLVHIQTCGQKNMPAYASQVRLADRWRVVLYLRELQRLAVASKP